MSEARSACAVANATSAPAGQHTTDDSFDAEDLCLSRLRQAAASGTCNAPVAMPAGRAMSRSEIFEQVHGLGRTERPRTAAQSATPSAASAIGEEEDTPVVVPTSSTSMTSMEEQLRAVSAVMESDLATIRERIISERGDRKGGEDTAGELTADEEAKAQSELRRRHQVDLNDERNLADLEDKGLMSHMEKARAALVEQAKRQQDLPKRDEIRARHVKNLRAFSSLVQGLQTAGQELLCGVEDTFLQSSNATKLSKGERPHSFPEVPIGKPANRDALIKLAEKIDTSAVQCQKTNTAITDTVNGIDVLRREYEMVVDAYAKHIDHYRASHEALMQILGNGPGSGKQ